jgi:hypothetical protein
VKGVVPITIEEIGPLCEVEAVDTMVAQTGDGGLGSGKCHVVTTVVGIEQFPEGVTSFVSLLRVTLFGTRKGESIR